MWISFAADRLSWTMDVCLSATFSFQEYPIAAVSGDFCSMEGTLGDGIGWSGSGGFSSEAV